jgi:uncharacterized low-complexity protein
MKAAKKGKCGEGKCGEGKMKEKKQKVWRIISTTSE